MKLFQQAKSKDDLENINDSKPIEDQGPNYLQSVASTRIASD